MGYLSFKVTFLLSTTSVSRVGEFWALSASHPDITFLLDRILLRYLPTLIPKVSTFENINKVISLPVFNPEPSSEEEVNLHSLFKDLFE